MSNHNKLSQDTLHVEQKPDKAHPEQASNFATVVTKNSQWKRKKTVVRKGLPINWKKRQADPGSRVGGHLPRPSGGKEREGRDRERDTGKYR